MRLRSVILALAVCTTSWAAHAQPIQGVYVGAGAGARIALPTKNTPLTPGIKGDFDLSQSLGYDARVSAGYALGNGWRFELEGTFGRANVKGVSGTAFPATGAGSVRNLGFMANALFDLDVGSRYVYPYLGLGAGYQSTRLNGFALTRTDKPLFFTASGQAGGFAAQAIAGLSFPIPNTPGLSLTVDYRFMDILGGEKFGGTTSFGPPPAAPPLVSATKFHNQFNQSVMLGVRYAFNTPPPAGVAPLAMAQAPGSARVQTFLVNFDPDRATLTDRAQGIVKEAAADSTRRQTTRIEVTGNADASGNASLNHVLSERRAKAVAAALIGGGVPRDAIAIQVRGNTNAAVPAGSGVEQPRDRRVEIVSQ